MLYYSTITKVPYETVEELEAAEAKVAEEKKAKEAKEAARKERAKEVEDAFKAAQDAQNAANEKLKEFVKDYGSFHMSLKNEFPRGTSLMDFMLSRF